MPNLLKKLIITKVALCPKGQNPEADFVFFKEDDARTPSSDPGETPKPPNTKEAAVKDYSKMTQDELIAELTSRDNATPEGVSPETVAALQKSVENQAEELKKANERLAKAEEDARVEKEKREHLEDVSKGKEMFPYLPLNDEEKAALAKQVRTLPKEAGEVLVKALNAGNTACADLTKEKGSDNGDTTTAKDKLRDFAKEIQSKNVELTFQQAYDLACQQHADLYKEARAEE